MSRVLVVARTRMNQGRVCVGGHDLDQDFRSLRLLTKAGMNIKEEAGIDVGEVWELDYEDHPEPDPPHVEDVLVSEGKRIETLPLDEVRALILKSEAPWAGGPDALFDGTVVATQNGRVYVPGDGPLPGRSTGYWTPDDEIVKHIAYEKARFLYVGSGEFNGFTWAGMADPPPRIARGTLVRVSLARWHDPASAPAGYYTQISGVY
jgi:Dual OB-containing domain